MPLALLPATMFGLIIGSFLNVVAHRLPRGESLATPGSHCPSCDAAVKPWDNIPVLSWLLLRGRCRSCDVSIPVTYPLIELAVGALFVASFLVFDGDWAEVAIGCASVALLATITLTDLEDRIIPNVVLLAGVLTFLAIAIPTGFDDLPEHLIAAAIAFGVLLAVALAYPNGMGMGDVKLAGVMGLYLGKSVAPALLIGFAVGAIVGVALIARHGSEARKQAVPFGPFLALGGIVALFTGEEIVDWYVDSFVQ